MARAALPDVGTRQLEAVLALAEYGSFVAAAARLRLSQPALTRNAHGAGTAWYLSTKPDTATLRRILVDVLAHAGVEVEEPPAGVEVVVRRSSSGTWRILLNHADSEATVHARGIDALTGERVDGVLALPAGAVRIVRTDAVG